MTLDEIVAEAESLAELTQRLKQRAMCFQARAKEIVAAYYGWTFSQVDLPYERWMDLRACYENETGRRL